jgi:predicted RNA binding protein with dsRBD fold (UPF0201 family)
MMEVIVATPLYPTEDEGVVRKAMLNLFPSLQVAPSDGKLMGRASGPRVIARLRRRLREMRIRDTARSVCSAGIQDGRVTFALNKQSAYARVPNFSTGGAPLGDIIVIIETEDPSAVVEWLCEQDTD